ncbi:MAG TPA: hypothetical protein VK638_26970 [Edaphobacter sp.]|nr:hypothetical protein [Edaphobacter sp.]
MKRKKAALIRVLALLVIIPSAPAQETTQSAQTDKRASTSPDSAQNIQAYVELLRSDVRQQKAQMMGSVMQLSAADATKFWPIYSEYDAELTKLNDLRVANIQNYASSYTEMTDEKADELIRNGLAYRKQRSELLEKYYERVKQALGAITAARFLQIEDQLLLLIDLQIDSSLPIVGTNS